MLPGAILNPAPTSLVRLVKSALANAPPEVDVSYIPPVLACDAWPALHGDILQSLYDRIGRKRERLASALAARGGVIFGGDPQDAVSAAHLRELNESYAVLSVVAFTPGIPPLTAYTELCRLVGQLAIFDRSGRWPAIPPYDHDDLGGCFYRVKVYLDTLLDILPEPEYKERPFIGMGLRMQAAIEPTWLDPAWELYLGVRSEMDPDEMMRLLTVPGQLDMKAGSGDRVDAIYQLGQAGLRFEPCPKPGLLPDLAGQRYCRLSRQPEREWGAVTRSLIKRQGRSGWSRHALELRCGSWLLRLRCAFATAHFRSAVSGALRLDVGAELDALFKAASGVRS